MVHPPLQSTLALLKEGKYSDFKIVCGPVTFQVHKAILELNSEFFGAMFRNSCKENKEGVAYFPEDDPFIMAHTLDFIYLGEYLHGQPSVNYTVSEDHDSRAIMKSRTDWALRIKHHIDMYMAGDKLGISKLQDFSLEHATRTIELRFRVWPNFSQQDIEGLRVLLRDLPSCDELRLAVFAELVRHYNCLDTNVVQILDENEPVAVEVGQRLAKEIEQLETKVRNLEAKARNVEVLWR